MRLNYWPRVHHFVLTLGLVSASSGFAQAPADATPIPTPNSTVTPAAAPEFSPATKRKMQALALVFREASGVKVGSPERAKLFDEFMTRSGEFVREQPDVSTVWLLRANVALELNLAQEGWEAGRALIRLGFENSPDASVQQLFVQLERRNWLGEKPPTSAPVPAADSLTNEDRLELATLQRMVQMAAKQPTPSAITQALAEVLGRSAVFLTKHPDHLAVWHLRARLAMELNQRYDGCRAGQKLMALGAFRADNPKLSETMSLLNLRGWLHEPAVFVSGKSYTITDLNLQMIAIPAGILELQKARSDFSTGESFSGSLVPIVAQHSIPSEVVPEIPAKDTARKVDHIQPFWLGRTEVTQAQWEAIMGGNPSYFRGEDLPVENVSIFEAKKFCERLTERELMAGRIPPDLVYTLPTETQWEYACRAGMTGDFAADLNSMAWYSGNSGDQTHPVGQKQANFWGLQDMHGNVCEWCDGYYSEGNTLSFLPNNSAGARPCRGGGWRDRPSALRFSSSYRYGADHKARDLGFRLAVNSVRD